jgi:ubiquinone/menaquinone biosynthesis C-methylase UbiE
MQLPRNTFSEQSDIYYKVRPHYPSALYEWISQMCIQRKNAWDCATGNGQAAVGLSAYFETVQATDISEQQISYAMQQENITYSVSSAETTIFSPESFDLVVVAQALHWFDYDRFWPEVSRVARRDAFFCAWGYDWLSSTTEIDTILIKPLRSLLDPFWAKKNLLLWNGYHSKDIAFPYERLETPSFVLETQWQLDHLLEYMMTWSAFKNSRGDSAVVASIDQLISVAKTLVLSDKELPIRMPLKIVAGWINK